MVAEGHRQAPEGQLAQQLAHRALMQAYAPLAPNPVGSMQICGGLFLLG